MKKILLTKALLSISVFATITLTGCEKDVDPIMDYSREAIFISNEGSFQKSDASVSYYHRSSRFIKHKVVESENNIAVLGDVLQNIVLHNDQLFMVLNNSGKVSIANATTLKLEGEIGGLVMPRYFAGLDDNKAYVTEWVTYDGNGRVAVIDLATRTISKTITVGINPEKLVVYEGKLYVVNQGGNTVSVIDTETDEVETSITVAHEPNSLVVDNGGTLWVLSNGNKHWQLEESLHTAGALAKINVANNTVERTFNFGSRTTTANNLVANGSGTMLYYVYGNKVYNMEATATALNTTALIDRGTYVERGFYGLGIDPVGGSIYAGKAPSFTDDGWVVRYNPTSGAALDSVKVGVAPNGFAFRE